MRTASRWRPLWVLLAGLPLAAAFAQDPGPAPQPSQLEEGDDAVSCDALYQAKRYADALAACERVLAHAERTARTAEIPQARYQVATILDQLDRDDEALEQLQRVHSEATAVGDLHRQLYALNRQGNIHSSQGSYERAIECFGEALAVPLDPAEVPALVHARANRGIAWYTIGNYVNALADLEHAREAYESAGHRNGRTSTYINLGLVNEALGELDSARGNFRRALELAEQDPIDERRIAEATHNLGYAAGAAGEYDVAAGYYTVSLRFAGDERARARTLNNLGAAFGEVGRYEEAARAIEESLAIAGRIGARALEGYALDSLGTVQAYRGESEPALTSYQRALLVAQETGDRRGQQLTLANLGRLLADTGQPSLATVFYKRSINISEDIRADLAALPESRRESYVQSVSGTYRKLAALLIGQNRLLEAQRVIDLLKLQEADEFLGSVRGNGETAAGIPQTATEREILGDYDELSRKAVEAGIELATLVERLRVIPREERPPEDLERLANLRTLLDAMRAAFIAFLSSPEVREVMAEAQRRIGVEAVEIPQLDNIGVKLRELDRNAVVLYPLMLPDRVELLLATPRSEPIHRRVDVSQGELRAAVFEFRRALLDADADPLPLAQQLYDWLIRPIEPELERLGTELILYSPDDALRYVPVAALHDGESWLIERYRISNWTDSTIINLDHRMEGPLRVLGGAYTVPGHSFAIGDETFRFEGLEFAGKEMETIATMLDGTLSFPGDAFVFDDLYRELFDFNVLHLATHAAVVVGQPSDSFILFGDGRRVTLQEIRSSLSFDVDLVVLSACETALGGGFSDGVEVLGLGYAMQSSKARSIVASLWRVSDGGTHALMSEFYRQLAGGATRVDALRAAQLLLIRNDADAVSAANRGVQLAQPVSSRLDHPYYWAPFILIGTGL